MFLSGSIKRSISVVFNNLVAEKKISSIKLKKLSSNDGGEIINSKGKLQIIFY